MYTASTKQKLNTKSSTDAELVPSMIQWQWYYFVSDYDADYQVIDWEIYL